MTGRYAFSEIEPRWQQVWDEQQVFRAAQPGAPRGDRPKYYCLDMFPYPSGDGLHVGHPEGYTATDIISRYKRMCGFNVLHPMGWDAFGLPAEQYAIRTGVHPAVTTKRAIDTFRRQLKRFGFSYDWSREFATIDPDYYRWTQWIFLQIYNAWYDVAAGRARPIAELISELESGRRSARLNPHAPEQAKSAGADKSAGAAPESWSAASRAERRAIIDSYRLAYLGEVTVNWCPKLGTALANEEVIDGKSERGGFPVFRKPMKQWLFRITAYAERLLLGLKDVDWPESTRTLQTEWIGRSEGAEVAFQVVGGEELRVFTTRPDTIFGATFMVVAPEHPLVEVVLNGKVPTSAIAPEFDRSRVSAYVEAARNRSDVERQESKEKSGVFLGVHCRNPATGKPIPVWVADYVLMGYGTGAIMAVPGQDERDWEFAEKFGLPIVRTVQPPPDFNGRAFVGDGPAINSDFLNGLPIADAKRRIIAWLEEQGVGRGRVNYRLRDWVFSRQRYWGEPFPIVYDEQGVPHPVGEDHLPVRLPDLVDYAPIESDDPQPLLAKADDWVNTTAGVAGVADLPAGMPVRRETNTMPGWAGSCWYYLRYCDPQNSNALISTAAEQYWVGGTQEKSNRTGASQERTENSIGETSASGFSIENRKSKIENPLGGVDLYIGGAEHAVLHLLYARFWHKVLFDLGRVTADEPFRRLFHQGMITSFAYQRPDKSLLPTDQVEERGEGQFVEKATGLPVAQIIAKMSKSLKNVVNPDDIIAEFGADTFRLYEMYMGPLEASKPWNTRDIVGPHRFLQRVWRLVVDEDATERQAAESNAASLVLNPRLSDERDAGLERLLHKTIKKVGGDIERFAFNTAIAEMIKFVNEANKAERIGRDQVMRFLLVLSPFAPHIAEELWSLLGGADLASGQAWPEYDEALTRDDEIEYAVQINGKVKARLMIASDAAEAAIVASAKANEAIAKEIAGKAIKREFVVKGRLVNLIV